MSYQVLARKWRPRRFEDMVGQQHVLQALVHALDEGRLHHAYLFTGTRGVGKTTLARIFAKAVNCEAGVSSKPCGECSACREIDEGRFVDLIEVDAASRTKVDETRELLDNVHYAPTRGRYKVYLIDEVHMFSNHSFNALLKTLEEPPPHVKFLLATTDPKKLPVTILSRCLQFNLKRLTPAQIEKHLEHILVKERVESDRNSRRLVADAADGSVRDALSLLDQAIAFGGGALREAEVGAMLGTIDRQQIFELLRLLVQGDAAAALRQARRIAEANPDFSAVLAELLALLQRMAVVQVLGAEGETLEEDEGLRALAARLSPEDCQLYYQIGLIGRRDLPLSPDPAGGLEMVLLRMLAFRPAGAEPAAPSAPESGAARTGGAGRSVRADAPPQAVAAPAPSAPGGAPGPRAESTPWSVMLNELGVSGRVRELAAQCVYLGTEGNLFRLALAPAYANLRSPAAEGRLEQAVQARHGAHLRLQLSLQEVQGAESPAQARSRREVEREEAALAAIESDPNVTALRESFGAIVEKVSPRAPD
ncbi:MAG: DNA polymerase III subunit gamma/tau [Gammaproteobacteria bacterium]